MCGCALEAEARHLPKTGIRASDEAKREAYLEAAREWRDRWGCPRGRPVLDADLQQEAEAVAEITGTPVASTCPLACLYRADLWVVEITRAAALAGEWHVPIETTLGRDLTPPDIAALATLNREKGAAAESDRKAAERRRKAKIE